jgi:hypothetical protein
MPPRLIPLSLLLRDARPHAGPVAFGRGGTRSVAGIIMGLAPTPSDTNYQQVYVQMGYYVQAIAAGSAPGGALLISGNQANTGVKTFSDSTIVLNNSGGTFATTFHTAATAARSLTFPDIASANVAVLEGTQEWVGVKTWPSTGDPLFKKEQDHTLKVDDTTTAAARNDLERVRISGFCPAVAAGQLVSVDGRAQGDQLVAAVQRGAVHRAIEVGQPLAPLTKIVGSANEPFAEMVLPDPIHHHPRGQGVPHNRFSQLQPAAALRKGQRISGGIT